MLDYDILKQNTTPEPRHVLLVFHGLGADKHNLKFLIDFWPQCGLHAYFFQAPLRPDTFFHTGQLLNSWFDLGAIGEHNAVIAQQQSDILQQCQKIIAPLLKQGVVVHTAGFSQGGVMALAATEYFSCQTVGLFSTFWPAQELPHMRLEPVFFQTHGLKDTIVPSHARLKLYEAISKKYHIEAYNDPELGHEFSWEMGQKYQQFLCQRV